MRQTVLENFLGNIRRTVHPTVLRRPIYTLTQKCELVRNFTAD
jgi:hypothetical protein